MKFPTSRVAFVLFLCLSAPASARAGEFYYVLIFGSETHPKRLKHVHTWATFVKATGEGEDANNYALEVLTLSWNPASMNVKVFSPHPEPGVNLDLHQTLAKVGSEGQGVTMWGPFRIGPQIWNRAVEEYNKLASGTESYRAISGPRDLSVSDCIHAVAAVDPQFGRNHYPLIRVGKAAGKYIARQVAARGQIDQSESDNFWVFQRLGLEAYPIRVVPPSRVTAD